MGRRDRDCHVRRAAPSHLAGFIRRGVGPLRAERRHVRRSALGGTRKMVGGFRLHHIASPVLRRHRLRSADYFRVCTTPTKNRCGEWWILQPLFVGARLSHHHSRSNWAFRRSTIVFFRQFSVSTWRMVRNDLEAGAEPISPLHVNVLRGLVGTSARNRATNTLAASSPPNGAASLALICPHRHRLRHRCSHSLGIYRQCNGPMPTCPSPAQPSSSH